jgi:hypothetical protein
MSAAKCVLDPILQNPQLLKKIPLDSSPVYFTFLFYKVQFISVITAVFSEISKLLRFGIFDEACF